MDHPPPLSAGTVLLQLAAVFALVLANGFFVASEFALVAVILAAIGSSIAEQSKKPSLANQLKNERR